MNLWNVSQQNNHKTRRVINYIENLQYPEGFGHDDIVRFDKIRREALAKLIPDEMLERIGYNPVGGDGIYDEAIREKV